MSVVANVAINVDSSGAVSKLRQVQTQATATQRAFGALQSAIGALGVGFALTKVIADVKELDTNLRRLGTVGIDVGKISPALSKLSDELGGVASKAELAAASYQAASAGFSDTAGNINILRAATKAAVGGLADTQAVTEVLVKTLNSYGMSGNQAIQVTDSISKAVELGNQEWSDYTSQLGRVASIAALAGVSLDEVNTFIASATKNGATAEIAFTGLGATLSQILTPTKESQEAAAKLGIQWNLAGINAKGFSGLMDELAAAMDKDKEAAARMVGPIEAARGAFAAASKDGSDFKNILEQVRGAAGKTDADFQTMKGSLENTLKALDTSFKNLSEALGKAFGPTLVIVIQDITKAVNGFADFMATVPQPVMNTAGELVKLIAQMLLLQKAIQAIIALRAAFIGAMVGMTGATVASGTAATTSAGAFALYTANARTLQATSIAAAGSVSGLSAALLSLAAIGIITVGINYVITQTGAILGSSTAAGKSEAAGTAGGLAAQLKGKSAAERKKMLAAAQKNLANDKKLASALALQIQMQDNAALSSSERALPSDRSKLTELQARINTNQARIKAIQTTPIERAAVTGNAMGTPVGAVVGDTKGKGTGSSQAANDAKRAADEAARAAEQIREQTKAAESLKIQQQGSLAILRSSNDFEKAFVEFSVKRTEIQRRYSELTLASKSDEERKLLTEARALEFKQSSFELQKQIAELTKQATAPLDDIVSKLKDQVAFEREYGELIKNGTNPELAKQIIEINRAYEASAAALVPALAAAQAAVTKAEAEGASATEIQKYREELERIQEIQSGLPAKKTDAIGAATELTKPKTDQQNITEKIATLKKEITDLTSISNIAITSAESIGNAFAQSFQGLISGTMTAKEALGSFFKSVADMFLEMAAQIIAKQITMIILQTILKALGAVGGASSVGAGATNFGGAPGVNFNPGAFSMPALAANGATFANGIAKFASGGIVSSPTMFKFADGGAMRTGLMGEAGPEAIMPLKRGADGSLGVQANGLREAMNSQGGGNAGSPVLNMSFESTTIGGVEYVSRDQLEQAMAETRRSASRDGAQRGMTMTLDRIQNSSSTRRRVGI